MLYKDISETVIGASFEVMNELGGGFLESVYQKALVIALRQKGLLVEEQVPLAVLFRGENVGQFFADIIAEGRVLVELKSAKNLAPEHQVQIINYLKATGMEVGLLINFGPTKLEYRRFHNKS